MAGKTVRKGDWLVDSKTGRKIRRVDGVNKAKGTGTSKMNTKGLQEKMKAAQSKARKKKGVNSLLGDKFG